MDAETEVDKQTSQRLVEMTALHSENEPPLHQPPLPVLRKRASRDSPGQLSTAGALALPLPTPPPQKDREGLHGGFLPGLWPWTHAQAWQGPCFLPLPSAMRVTHWLGGGLSALP